MNWFTWSPWAAFGAVLAVAAFCLFANPLVALGMFIAGLMFTVVVLILVDAAVAAMGREAATAAIILGIGLGAVLAIGFTHG